MSADRKLDLSNIPDLTRWEPFAKEVPHDVFDYLRAEAPVFGQPKVDSA